MKPSLPKPLLDSLTHVTGFDARGFIAVHESDASITSIRLNPFKPFKKEDSNLAIDEKVAWSSFGYYLKSRPSFTLDPIFHAGGYYVQEASSMFLEEVLKQCCDVSKSLRVLDLCAAPGGKSTLIQSLISSESLLISNEVIKSRASILTENITKWGAMNTVVTNNDPKDFQRLPQYFDVIVADAPCSGSGLFRKDPNAVNEWSENNVALCSQRQERILSDVLPSLKPGGILIYSTCSYSVSENEDIMDWMLANHEMESIQIQLQQTWNIIETTSPIQKGFGYRFYPDKIKGEGFFISAFRKKTSTHIHQGKNNSEKLPFLKNKSMINDWAVIDEQTCLFQWKDTVIAIPDSIQQEIPYLQKTLYLKKAGVSIGTLIRDRLLPSHELAMSGILSTEIPVVTLELEDALNYLRLNTFNISNEEPGWRIIQYKGMPLGFIKALPNRFNNYYPKEWRIIK